MRFRWRWRKCTGIPGWGARSPEMLCAKGCQVGSVISRVFQTRKYNTTIKGHECDWGWEHGEESLFWLDSSRILCEDRVTRCRSGCSCTYIYICLKTNHSTISFFITVKLGRNLIRVKVLSPVLHVFFFFAGKKKSSIMATKGMSRSTSQELSK